MLTKTYDCNMCKGIGRRRRIKLEDGETSVVLNPIILEEYMEKYPNMEIVSTQEIPCHFCDAEGKVDWIQNILNNPRPEDLKKRYFKVTPNMEMKEL